MKPLLGTVVAGLAIIAMAIFHDHVLAAGLFLILAGLTFAMLPPNRWEEVTAICIGGAGGFLILDFSTWSFLLVLAGIFLIVSNKASNNHDCSIWVGISVSLAGIVEKPVALIICGGMVILYGLIRIGSYYERELQTQGARLPTEQSS